MIYDIILVIEGSGSLEARLRDEVRVSKEAYDLFKERECQKFVNLQEDAYIGPEGAGCLGSRCRGIHTQCEVTETGWVWIWMRHRADLTVVSDRSQDPTNAGRSAPSGDHMRLSRWSMI